ncbi:hypothetical protein E2C01_073952 [Portunus trituberculatus]|uniref:Uncharacterized protein n=1 Tax=Portunus trituberculatus TaxID=210409 RepID=A0A5B7IFG2_PORTR|nr:hypothetical protein [Portunus trituberculatus]
MAKSQRFLVAICRHARRVLFSPPTSVQSPHAFLSPGWKKGEASCSFKFKLGLSGSGVVASQSVSTLQ